MTPEFLSPLRVEHRSDGTWVLTNPLRYRSTVLKSHMIVPIGFVTDFASVPRLPLAYVLAGDTAHPAAVVHDYLYQTHMTTKDEADDIFEEAMGVSGEPWWRRKIMSNAVRWFGGSAWDSGPERYKVL